MIMMVINYFYYQRHKNICSGHHFNNKRQKLSKLLSKGFERSVYLNEYQTKRENKSTGNEHRYFLKPNFVGVNRYCQYKIRDLSK